MNPPFFESIGLDHFAGSCLWLWWCAHTHIQTTTPIYGSNSDARTKDGTHTKNTAVVCVCTEVPDDEGCKIQKQNERVALDGKEKADGISAPICR